MAQKSDEVRISTFCLQNSDFIGAFSIRLAWDAYSFFTGRTRKKRRTAYVVQYGVIIESAFGEILSLQVGSNATAIPFPIAKI